MAELTVTRKVLRRGGKYCVAGGPNNVSCMNTSYTTGVSMYMFPKDERRQRVKFVRKHRANFEPSSSSPSALCSDHFEATSFIRRQDISLDDKENPSTAPVLLRRLEAGAIPTIDTVGPVILESTSARGRRQVSLYCRQNCNSCLNVFGHDLGVRTFIHTNTVRLLALILIVLK